MGSSLWRIMRYRLLSCFGSCKNYARRYHCCNNFARFNQKLHDKTFNGRMDVGKRIIPSTSSRTKCFMVQSPCLSSQIIQFNQSKCMEKILSGECSTQTAVSKCSDSTVKHVTSDTSIGKAARIIQNNDYVFVVDNGTYKRTIYHSDILDFIQKE